MTSEDLQGRRVTESSDNGVGGGDPRARGLFISYRRGETSGQARAIYEHLSDLFGEERVFMDVDSIAPGTDFVSRIEEALDASGVMLVLIGRDWVERGDEHDLLNDPSDFVRLELAIALERKVPAIPVLVERAQMPDSTKLPEQLRSIARINALELENARWDFDVTRLVSTVQRYLDPRVVAALVASAPVSTSELATTSSTPKPGRGPFGKVRSKWIGVAAVVAAVAVAAVLVIPHLIKKTPQTSLVTATSVVAPVPPDRLVASLLASGLPGSDVPSGTTAQGPHLAAIYYTNLDADVTVPMSGPAVGILVDYEVYDDEGDASASFADSIPMTAGMTVNSDFSIPSMGDQTRCGHGHNATTKAWGSGCLTQSANVLVFVEATSLESDTAQDNSFVSALDLDMVRHLHSVAASASHKDLVTPPGALAPSALYDQLQSSTFDPALLPEPLTSPQTTVQSVGSTEIPGLVQPDVIITSFTGPQGLDEIDYFVFGDKSHAQHLFTSGLTPTNSKSTGPVESSGSALPTRCESFTSTSGSKFDAISCFVLDGDVVVESRVVDNATLDDLADIDVVTLARIGTLHLADAATS